MLNPLPVQGFADDIAIVTYDERSLHEMINVSEPIMQRVNLDVKASICTVLYGRRSGNNWYTGKNDKKPNIALKKKNIKVSKRIETYEYLGKLITINSDDPKQVSEIISTYKNQVAKNSQSKSLLSFKVCALNNTVLDFFCNTYFQDKLLLESDTFFINKVRELFFYISQLPGM